MQFAFSTNVFREFGLDETIEALVDADYDRIEILLDELSPLPGDD